MTNKELAVSFLNMAAMGNVKAAYEKYVAHKFIHHNQYFKGDRQSLLTAMEEASKVSPNKSFEVKQAFTDGDFVVTHSLVVKSEMNISVVHIFRFEKNQVVELWDVGQQIIKNSPNENGLF